MYCMCTHVHVPVHCILYMYSVCVCVCVVLCVCVCVCVTFDGEMRAPTRGNTVAPPNSTSDIFSNIQHRTQYTIHTRRMFNIVGEQQRPNLSDPTCRDALSRRTRPACRVICRSIAIHVCTATLKTETVYQLPSNHRT